mgnify:CR=1 FL=1
MDSYLENNINNDINNNLNENIEKEQKNFIGEILGKTINLAIDTGVRMLLPNAIEDEIIKIKDVLLNEGLKEGIKNAISSALDLGKSAIGIVTGEFENVSQAYTAVKNGGIIDTTSKIIDQVLKSANKKGLINDGTAKILKKGKNVVKECVESNIEKTFMEQVDSVEKIGKYINNWNNYLEARDSEGMEREYTKIENKMKNILPLETTIKQVEIIHNIQTLIKNKGGIENITNEEIELSKKLI